MLPNVASCMLEHEEYLDAFGIFGVENENRFGRRLYFVGVRQVVKSSEFSFGVPHSSLIGLNFGASDGLSICS